MHLKSARFDDNRKNYRDKLTDLRPKSFFISNHCVQLYIKFPILSAVYITAVRGMWRRRTKHRQCTGFILFFVFFLVFSFGLMRINRFRIGENARKFDNDNCTRWSTKWKVDRIRIRIKLCRGNVQWKKKKKKLFLTFRHRLLYNAII